MIVDFYALFERMYNAAALLSGGDRLLLKLKKIASALTTVYVVLMVVFALLLVGVRVVGISPYVVLSGSMEPKYPVGSMIYVSSIDPSDLQVGDPVTYKMEDGTVVTHRIVERIQDPDWEGRFLFLTTGDANNIVDGALLSPERIIGKPVFAIPLLGFLAYFVQNPPGTYVVISASLFLLILPTFLNALIEHRKKEDDADPQQECQ